MRWLAASRDLDGGISFEVGALELYGSQTFAFGATKALMCFYRSYPLIIHIHLSLISFYH